MLSTQHSVPLDVATQITSSYLRAFRRCPDNPDVPLATWRELLWFQALPDTHKHLANDVYHNWLELRYKYLELSTETIALLQSLRQCYLLAIITNGPSNAQWEKINRLNINKYFDCILVSADLPWEKPDKHIFYAACNYLGVQPDNCVMIGDKLETDIQVCYTVADRQGGIEAKLGGTIWIPLNGDLATASSNNSLIKPDCTITDLQDLMTLLPSNVTNPRKNSFRSKIANDNRPYPYNRRVASLPDLENGNSNSSDGS